MIILVSYSQSVAACKINGNSVSSSNFLLLNVDHKLITLIPLGYVYIRQFIRFDCRGAEDNAAATKISLSVISL